MSKDIEELLTALRLTEAMREMGKEGLEALVAKEATGIEKMIASAKAKKDGRTAAGKRRARKNYQKRWMRAKREKLLNAIPQDGWYTYLMTNRKGWKISREEWEEHIQPSVGTGWLSIHTYNSKEPYTLGNIYILDNTAGTTIFDGKDYLIHNVL